MSNPVAKHLKGIDHWVFRFLQEVDNLFIVSEGRPVSIELRGPGIGDMPAANGCQRSSTKGDRCDTYRDTGATVLEKNKRGSVQAQGETTSTRTLHQPLCSAGQGGRTQLTGSKTAGCGGSTAQGGPPGRD